MLAAVAVVALILFALVPSHPRWIPLEPPREEWRVVHPKGFSIVCPPGWSVRIVSNPPYASAHDDRTNTRLREFDFINLRAGGKKVSRAPRLFVSDCWGSAPDYLWAYHETRFLNMKAYENSSIRPGKEYFTYELLLTNQGRWYQIIYDRPIDVRNPPATNVPAMMLRYLQSFRPIP